MSNKLDYKFVNLGQENQPPKGWENDGDRRSYHPYLPSPGLVKAVNLAIDLQRPLLLEGEPGCGKTQLANALVYQLATNNPPNKDRKKSWPFFIWNVKSTSRARDGLYTFDAVARLRDAQMVGVSKELGLQETELKAMRERVGDPKEYRVFGELGKAIFDKTGEQGDRRPVLLIDEIDKAGSDFCNDLLLELDQFRFNIPETQEKIDPPQEPPIVILTSNREKPLPEAFLRRCLYFNIEFPSSDTLKSIAQQRFPDPDEALFEAVMQCFTTVRDAMKMPGSRKPSTSEFIDFLKALQREPQEQRQGILEDLQKHYNPNLPEEASFRQHLDLLGVLLKTAEDEKLYAKVLAQKVKGAS
jgi:MoxR-like ATPase